VGASKIARNITEQKRVAEAVRESEERLHLAAQAGRRYAEQSRSTFSRGMSLFRTLTCRCSRI
jgi:hypothetical protein